MFGEGTEHPAQVSPSQVHEPFATYFAAPRQAAWHGNPMKHDWLQLTSHALMAVLTLGTLALLVYAFV